MSELENGRLVRLLCKFGFINERPEYVFPSHPLLPLSHPPLNRNAPQTQPRDPVVRDRRSVHREALPGLRLPPGRRGRPAGREPHARPHLPQQARRGHGRAHHARLARRAELPRRQLPRGQGVHRVCVQVRLPSYWMPPPPDGLSLRFVTPLR